LAIGAYIDVIPRLNFAGGSDDGRQIFPRYLACLYNDNTPFAVLNACVNAAADANQQQQ